MADLLTVKNGYLKNLNVSVIKHKILKEKIFETVINRDVLWNKPDSD